MSKAEARSRHTSSEAFSSRLEGLFQPMHLLVIFFIALPVFGPRRKLPELGRGPGDGIRELKKGLQDSAASASTSSADQKPSGTKKG